MKPTRRQLLLGASATALSGTVVSSAAFTQVEADRTFEVTVADDAESQVVIEPGNTEAVNVSGGTIEIDIPNLNSRSRTQFTDALIIRNENQTDRPIFLYIPTLRDRDTGKPIPNSGVVEIIAEPPTQEFERRNILLPPGIDGKTGAQVIPRRSANEEPDEFTNEITLSIIINIPKVPADTDVPPLTIPFVAQRTSATTINDIEPGDFPSDDAWELPELSNTPQPPEGEF